MSCFSVNVVNHHSTSGMQLQYPSTIYCILQVKRQQPVILFRRNRFSAEYSATTFVKKQFYSISLIIRLFCEKLTRAQFSLNNLEKKRPLRAGAYLFEKH